MVFHVNNCKNIFRPLFCHFLPNSAIFRPPIFSSHGQFFGASLELFERSEILFYAVLTVTDANQCCQLFLKVSGQIFEKIRPLGKKIRPHMKTCFWKNK
jgi:hypothetical protein